MSTTAKLSVVFVSVLVVMLALGTVVTTRSLAQGPGGAPRPGTSLAGQVAALTTEVSTLQTNLNTLTSTVDTLQTNVAKLNGQGITADDLVGTYRLSQIQNELDGPVTGRAAEIGAYVIKGTATLNSNRTGSVTTVQRGNFLIIDQTMLVDGDSPPPPATATLTFDWTFMNGVITLSNPAVPEIDGLTIDVAAGGRVFTFVSSKHSDGTDALIIMTRL